MRPRISRPVPFLSLAYQKLITGTFLENISRDIYNSLSPTRWASYERQTFRVIKRQIRPNYNCIDVGAYRGYILDSLMKSSPGGTHFAFEPLPICHAYLKERFPDALVSDCALSDTTGEAEFVYVKEYPTYSGFRKIPLPEGAGDIRTIRVRTARMDDIIPTDTTIHMIKIDVEGAEYMVLRGGINTILRSRPVIIFEHGHISETVYGVCSGKVYDLLHDEYGMNVGLMKSWLINGPPLEREKFIEQVMSLENYYFIAYPR